jgi:hypothetical protein
MISVSVKGSVTTLDTPTNLRYDINTETFNFDSVSNAASYSIKINNQIINIGNSTTFELKDYAGAQYDNVLTVQVMANAPKYSFVFKNSEYCSQFNVYQASKAKEIKVEGGKLTFTKSTNSNALVYLGENLIATIEEGTFVSYSLKSLPIEYAGKQKQLTIKRLNTGRLSGRPL